METEVTFVISKKALEEGMKLLDAVPSRNGITSSEFIKTEIKEKHLRMSMSSDLHGDAIIPLASKNALKHPLYLDRRMLKPFVSAGVDLTKSDVYEFVVKGKGITVKHGSRTALLESSTSASGYEPLPDFKHNCLSIELQEEWTSIANCATLCACTDPIAPALNCVHVSPGKDKVYVRASDTLLVFQGILPSSAFPCSAPVALPLDLVDNLGLFSAGVCHYTDKWAMLQFSIGHLWQAVKRECRKSFPDTAIAEVVTSVAKQGKVVAILGTQSLVEAADRISGYMQAASRDNPVLTLKLFSGKKRARLLSNTVGASFDEIVMLEDKADADYTVAWSLAAVLPVLQYCKNIGSARIIQDDQGRVCLKAGKVSLVTSKEKKKSKKKKGK